MDYRFLKAFVLTAKHANFSRAAQELHIAQSAVSRQIRLLEESLHCQLLIRSPQKVMLTEKGKELYEQASRFDEWALHSFNITPATIRIGTIPGLLDSLVIPRICSYEKQGDFNFVIRSDSQPVIISMLEKGELDVCLVHSQTMSDQIYCRKLFSENVLIISKETLDPSRLHEYRWIHMGTASFLKKAAKKVSDRYIIVNSVSAILDLVEAGFGIAALPDHLLVDRKKLKTYDIGAKGQIFVAHWHYEIWPPHLKEFISSLQPVTN